MVNIPTISSLTNNNNIIGLYTLPKNGKEKHSPFSLLKTVHFQPEDSSGHYVRARALLADERIPVFPGFPRDKR